MDTEAELARLSRAFFAAVSFEAGGKPGYDAIRDLFISGGLLIRNTGDAPEVTTVDEFIAPRAELVASGALTEFYEGELEAVNQTFGTVAHRWCSYEKRGVQNGTAFAATGAISTQFVLTPGGWRMSSMAWDDAR
ncbi:hypothetical protein OM076_16460 [Solirubrobacter ginsenosidimutans]|uniref:DUF4440 domain-containing protein n=1 Tax=Solirubrobacter ginsenosidimutans TaxID=490573 RepID=A0A9X3MV52_9ACTN|nr:hypothetical protein [Solirubrobacter ginsenosidimutans]MDA0161868.1 hypothetical protein [Solirubrobacter ginsenosidimutans]